MLVLDNPKSAHIGPISYLGRSRRVPHEEKMKIPRQRTPSRLSLEYVIDVPHDVPRHGLGGSEYCRWIGKAARAVIAEWFLGNRRKFH